MIGLLGILNYLPSNLRDIIRAMNRQFHGLFSDDSTGLFYQAPSRCSIINVHYMLSITNAMLHATRSP